MMFWVIQGGGSNQVVVLWLSCIMQPAPEPCTPTVVQGLFDGLTVRVQLAQ